MNMLLVVNTGSSSVKFRLFGLALDLARGTGGVYTLPRLARDVLGDKVLRSSTGTRFSFGTV